MNIDIERFLQNIEQEEMNVRFANKQADILNEYIEDEELYDREESNGSPTASRRYYQRYVPRTTGNV